MEDVGRGRSGDSGDVTAPISGSGVVDDLVSFGVRLQALERELERERGKRRKAEDELQEAVLQAGSTIIWHSTVSMVPTVVHIDKLYVGMEMNVQDKNVNINGGIHGGDVYIAVAETIADSLNKVQSSVASDEIKKKLERLHAAVEQMCKELSADEAEQAADDLDSFASQVVSVKPRASYLKTSAMELLDKAAKVATAGATVVGAVKAIAALVGCPI